MTTEPIRDQIIGISSMATRDTLAELAEAYQRRTNRSVVVESVGGVDAARRVQDGEAFDFVVLTAEAIDRLAVAGRIAPVSRIDLARSGVAIAVAAGAPRPDVHSELAVRQAVLSARSIGHSSGPSGVHLAHLFERWGIAGTIATRIVQAPPGVPVGTLVARGDVELGFQQLSELMHLPGIDVIGPLPPEIQVITTFAAAVCVRSTQPEAANALLAFLASPEADSAKRRHGMQPAYARAAPEYVDNPAET
jgi:molybdate transport system substrate-binding protein